jgi:hypothetical protein
VALSDPCRKAERTAVTMRWFAGLLPTPMVDRSLRASGSSTDEWQQPPRDHRPDSVKTTVLGGYSWPDIPAD